MKRIFSLLLLAIAAFLFWAPSLILFADEKREQSKVVQLIEKDPFDKVQSLLEEEPSSDIPLQNPFIAK